MKQFKGSGEYTYKDDGSKHNFNYDYPIYDSLDEAVDELGETKILAMTNQTSKEDSANNSREAQKRANGHSVERTLTAEEKEDRKQSRKADRELLKLIKSNPEELAALRARAS